MSKKQKRKIRKLRARVKELEAQLESATKAPTRVLLPFPPNAQMIKFSVPANVDFDDPRLVIRYGNIFEDNGGGESDKKGVVSVPSMWTAENGPEGQMTVGSTTIAEPNTKWVVVKQ